MKLVNYLFEQEDARKIVKKKGKAGDIPIWWDMVDRLTKEGKVVKGQALSFYCPVYFHGQVMVKKLLGVKDELGYELVFSLPSIEDPKRVKVGLQQMEKLGLPTGKDVLKDGKKLRCYSILPGYEGVYVEDQDYPWIGYEAVMLGSFSMVPKEWLNAGDPYNQSYKFPGEKGYSPYWRIPSVEEFKKIRPKLFKDYFKETPEGVKRYDGF